MAYILRSYSIHPDVSACKGQALLPAVEPDYKNIITDANLRRRMSRIVKMGVACGLECIGTDPAESIGGIITATGLGCLTDTKKFMNNLIDQEEQLLNPTPFIQSTFNTVGAQIAQIKGIHGYNMTHVNRERSFDNALIDAIMLLDEERDKQVLVGAFDELTPESYDICQRLGMYRTYRAGEGATFFLLSNTRPSIRYRRPTHITSCVVYNNDDPMETLGNLLELLEKIDRGFKDIDYLITNACQPLSEVYSDLTHIMPRTAQCIFYKEKCGEYPTSMAYAVWYAQQILRRNKVAVIYNYDKDNNHSFILMHQCS